MSNLNEEYEKALLELLKKEEYEEFLKMVAMLPFDRNNCEEYLLLIRKVMHENRKDKELFVYEETNENRGDKDLSSSRLKDVMLEKLGLKEKKISYFEIELKMRYAIKEYLIRRLALNKYEDEDVKIIDTLEDFETRFNL